MQGVLRMPRDPATKATTTRQLACPCPCGDPWPHLLCCFAQRRSPPSAGGVVDDHACALRMIARVDSQISSERCPSPTMPLAAMLDFPYRSLVPRPPPAHCPAIPFPMPSPTTSPHNERLLRSRLQHLRQTRWSITLSSSSPRMWTTLVPAATLQSHSRQTNRTCRRLLWNLYSSGGLRTHQAPSYPRFSRRIATCLLTHSHQRKCTGSI